MKRFNQFIIPILRNSGGKVFHYFQIYFPRFFYRLRLGYIASVMASVDLRVALH